MKRAQTLGMAITLLLLLGACSSVTEAPERAASQDELHIASFDFSESELLAEIYAQALEKAEVPVVRLGAVGPREIVIPAMQNAQVDLVPEYLGSLLRFVGIDDPPDELTAAAEMLGTELDEFDLLALSPSAAVDSNVFVVNVTTSETFGLKALSDLAVAGLSRFGGPAECPDRPLCLKGLEDTYGVSFDEFFTQPSLAFTGEALRRGEIDVGLMFSTSPELDADDLVALEDDRNLQPPDNVVPVIRRQAMERSGPEIREALDRVSAELSTGQLRTMNRLVSEGESVQQVARDWLAAHD